MCADRKAITRRSSEQANNIYELLCEQDVGVLATIDSHGLPQMSVVYFTCSEDFMIGFGTKSETNKVRNITKNSRVQLLIFNEKTQKTMKVTGIANLTKEGPETREILQNMYRSSGRHDFRSPPMSKLAAGELVAYRIKPEMISMALFTRPQRGGYDMFETLDFNDS